MEVEDGVEPPKTEEVSQETTTTATDNDSSSQETHSTTAATAAADVKTERASTPENADTKPAATLPTPIMNMVNNPLAYLTSIMTDKSKVEAPAQEGEATSGEPTEADLEKIVDITLVETETIWLIDIPGIVVSSEDSLALEIAEKNSKYNTVRFELLKPL